MSLCMSPFPGSCYKDGFSTSQVSCDVSKLAQNGMFSLCGLCTRGSGSVISENVPVGVPIIHLALFHDKRLGCICYVPTSRHSSLIFKYNTKCENLQAGYVCIMWYLQLPDRQVWVCVFAWMIASEDKSMCRKRSCLLCRYARFSLSAHSCATAITVTVTVKLADKTQQAALDTCTCPIIFMCVCVWVGGWMRLCVLMQVFVFWKEHRALG